MTANSDSRAIPPLTLGSDYARRCARVTHNRYSPLAPPEPEVSEVAQQQLEDGMVFEEAITMEWADVGLASLVVLDADTAADRQAAIAATTQAMDTGVEVIINGRLPSIDGRAGAPDVLVRFGEGYLPVDMKNHRQLNQSFDKAKPGARGSFQCSTLAQPNQLHVLTGPNNKGGSWQSDAFQLAHYTRMLQALGRHPGTESELFLIGGIVGTSDFTASPLAVKRAIVWYDLAEAQEETYSASGDGRRKKHSPLERYDHEFAFRLKVAQAARAGGELVRPFRIAECDQCVWLEHCQQVAGPEDASFAITSGTLKIREWQFLYGQTGRLSIAELASIDPDQVLEGFRQHSVATRSVEDRLRLAVRRARMARDGIDIEPPDGSTWPQPPTADIEIDFDIEWDTDGRIYQWGLRIREGHDDTTAKYHPVVSFEPLDDEAEHALAEEFTNRVAEIIEQANSDGKTIAVFHWSHPELSKVEKFSEADSLLEPLRVDLRRWCEQNLFARQGFSIKKVATAFGFTGWDSVEKAGGANSQLQINRARTQGPEAEQAQQWCLAYNQADVAAQAFIRDELRKLRAAGP